MSIHPTSLWSVWPDPGSTTRVPFQISVYRAERISAENTWWGFLNCRIWQCRSVTRGNDLELAEDVCGLKFLPVMALVCLSATTILRLTQLRTHVSGNSAIFSMYRQHIILVSFVWETSMFHYLTRNLDFLQPFLNSTINWRAKLFSPSSFYSPYLSQHRQLTWPCVL